MNSRIAILASLSLLTAHAAWASDANLAPALINETAEQGDPVSQTALAVRYEHAEGVGRDFNKAIQLYCLAARAGFAEAQFKLGWMYANGRGVPRDDGVAAALFAMAAGQGHVYGARLLQYVRPQKDTQLPACLKPEAAPSITVITKDDVAPTKPAASLAQREHVPDGFGSAEGGGIRGLLRRLAVEYGIDPSLAFAIVTVESGFDAKAVSRKNAQGLMQLMPDTAARFGVKRVFDPEDNARGGLAYLRWLLSFFRGNVPFAIAAYNAGERAVEKYRGIPPYVETRNYVKKVTTLYKHAVHPFEPGWALPSPVVSRGTTLR